MLLFLNIGGGEFMFILLLAFLLFGADRMPEIVRSLGKGINYMQKASQQIKDQIKEQTGLDGDISQVKDVFSKVGEDVGKGFDPEFTEVVPGVAKKQMSTEVDKVVEDVIKDDKDTHNNTTKTQQNAKDA